MQNEKTIFSANLKAKVVQMNLSHEAAAQKLHVDVETFRAWLYGKNWPPPPILLEMVEVFYIDDLYLFCKKNCA